MFGQYDAKWIIHMAGTNDINRSELISRYCYDKFINQVPYLDVSLHKINDEILFQL